MTRPSPKKPAPSFDAPAESDWHHAIAEAAYYLAEKRGFSEGYALEDWLAAEAQVRQVISPPTLYSEVTVNQTKKQKRPESKAEKLGANLADRK